MTITEFLEARISEDEARASSGGALLGDTRWETDNYGRDFLTPSAVLAECAAKRAILDTYHGATEWARNSDCPDVQAYSGMACGLGDALRALTAIYKDHPDYDEGWAL